MTKKKAILIGAIAIVLLIIVCILKPFSVIKFFNEINSGDYNSVYISQFNTENFDFESYKDFKLDTIAQIDVSSLSYLQMCEMLVVSLKSDKIEDIYLGIDFDQIHKSEMLRYVVCHNPNIHYEINIESICFANEDDDFDNNIEAVKYFVSDMGNCPNITIVWPGFSEAVAINSNNFDNNGLIKSLTLNYLYDIYYISPENVDEKCAMFYKAAENYRNVRCADLSDVTIIYLSDSIIGLTEPENSIPVLVNLLTGANNIDLSVGGAMCAYHPENSDNRMTHQIDKIPVSQINESDTEKIVVVNFGLNDFFWGIPASDGSDNSYEFWLECGVKRVQELIPDAHVIVMAPTYVAGAKGEKACFNGKDRLPDYRMAAERVAQNNNCSFIDNYTELGIDDNNYSFYYAGEVHLNENGRLLYALNLIDHIEEIENNEPIIQ